MNNAPQMSPFRCRRNQAVAVSRGRILKKVLQTALNQAGPLSRGSYLSSYSQGCLSFSLIHKEEPSPNQPSMTNEEAKMCSTVEDPAWLGLTVQGKTWVLTLTVTVLKGLL